MSVLTKEYDAEAAKRVYGEELMEELAREMLADGEPVEKIMKWTRLSSDTVTGYQNR